MTAEHDPDDQLAARLTRSASLQDAPEAVIQRAILLFERSAPRASAAPGLLRRAVEAVLRFDSALAAPMAFGLRNGSDGTRQLLYFCEGRDVDIRITPQQTSSGTRWRLSGQVLGPDVEGTVELRSSGGERQAAWDALCEFSFDDVPAGVCVLVLNGQGWTAALPPFEVPT